MIRLDTHRPVVMNDDDIDALGACAGACHQGREPCSTPAICSRRDRFAMLVQQVRDFFALYRLWRGAGHRITTAARFAYGTAFSKDMQ